MSTLPLPAGAAAAFDDDDNPFAGSAALRFDASDLYDDTAAPFVFGKDGMISYASDYTADTTFHSSSAAAGARPQAVANMPTFAYAAAPSTAITVLGQGMYGCILKAAVPCQNPRLPSRREAMFASKKAVTKVMNEEAAAVAWQMNELMMVLDPKREYTVPITQTCEITAPGVRRELLSKCKKSLKDKPLAQLTMPLGITFLSVEYQYEVPYFEGAFVQLLNATRFAEICDENTVAHGDIKAPNFLLVNDELKYIDFDLVFSYLFTTPPAAAKLPNWRETLVFPEKADDIPIVCFADVGYFPPECSLFKRLYDPSADVNAALEIAKLWLQTELSPFLQAKMHLFTDAATSEYARFTTHVLTQGDPLLQKQAAYHPEKMSVFQLGLVLAKTLSTYGFSEDHLLHRAVVKVINSMTRTDPRQRASIQEAHASLKKIALDHLRLTI